MNTLNKVHCGTVTIQRKTLGNIFNKHCPEVGMTKDHNNRFRKMILNPNYIEQYIVNMQIIHFSLISENNKRPTKCTIRYITISELESVQAQTGESVGK